MKDYRTGVRWPGVAAGLGVSVALAVAFTTVGGAAGAPGAGQVGGSPRPCSAPRHRGIEPARPIGPAEKPTTVTTIGQAYFLIFKHYYTGPLLDDQVLLAGAFAGLAQELDRLGLDQPDATMPALRGSRISDWAAFAAVYQRIIGELPASAPLRQEVAAATMTGMVAALHDNHAGWGYPGPAVPGRPSDATGWGSPPRPERIWRRAPRVRRCRRCLSPRWTAAPRQRAAGCGPVTSSPRSTGRPRSWTGCSPPA